VIWLEINSFVSHRKHAVDFHQRQDSFYFELALKAKLFSETLDSCFVELDFVRATTLVVETLHELLKHLIDVAIDFVVKCVIGFALAVQAEKRFEQSVQVAVLQVEVESVLLHFVLFRELVHLVWLRRTVTRHLNQLAHC
jgi:hypothetical protein